MTPVYTFQSVTDSEGWDAFASTCPDATAFHSSEWKRAVNASFPQYLPDDGFLHEGDRTIGGWSGFVFAPLPFLTFAEASPWHLFGGFLTPTTDPPEEAFLAALAAWECEARRRGRCALSWTMLPPLYERFGSEVEAAGFAPVAEKTTHLLDLPEDAATLWKNYKGSVRTDVRKARKSGVTVRPAGDATDVETFYAIYAETMRRFGSLAKPRSLLEHVAFSPIGRLLVAEREGRIVAGLLHLHFARTLTIWVEASIPEERRYGPNHALYHTALEWAIENGYRRADFGASPPENVGLMRFKESFGAKPASFATYRKVLAPIRASLWERAEPLARKAYGFLGRFR